MTKESAEWSEKRKKFDVGKCEKKRNAKFEKESKLMKKKKRHATESTVHIFEKRKKKLQSATFQRLTINNTCVYLSKHEFTPVTMKKMPMKRS